MSFTSLELQALKKGPKLKNHPKAEIGQNFLRLSLKTPFVKKAEIFMIFISE